MPAPDDSTARAQAGSPLRNTAFLLLLTAAAGTFAGFALLVSVVPLWVVEQGSGEFAAGSATGVFMASTVAAQVFMSGLIRRFGYRAMATLGAALLGAPAPVLLLATDWPAILALSLLRGVGFGFVTVCGSALIAELLPARMLGRGSGLYGLAVGTPLLVGLPASAWLAQNIGFAPVFVAGAVLPLLAAVPLALLPATTSTARSQPGGASRDALAVWRPWVVMLSGSIAFGALLTFLPLVFASAPLAGSLALLLLSASALGARWLAGVASDRSRSAGHLLALGLAGTAAGLGGLAAGAAGLASAGGIAVFAVVAALVCVAVYGAGFGVVQNDALVVMFTRVPAARASVAWNVAFDTGQGAGAVAVGALVAAAGYPAAFGMLAAAALLLLPVAWQRRSATSAPRRSGVPRAAARAPRRPRLRK